MSDDDLTAIRLTVELATLTTSILILLGTPIAYWLATTRSPFRNWVASVIGLPLVLPPSVLGFYLLLGLGPHGFLGRFTTALGLGPLAFTFTGITLGSVVFSMPFVVQPLQNAFESIGTRPIEVAASLGAGPWDRFFSVVVPLARPGFIVAAVSGFAHTVGEFGVVLMIGGNIPGQTRVVSLSLYDHVEALEYAEAHRLAGLLVVFSIVVLFVLNSFRGSRYLSAR
ncbi:MAG TPA: molybdate ABC transporter permease subunit [Polyangiaceae bacterium]|nr:molybdate ABC transporter permease subunit [Polyangiaceae bacterium]